MTEFGSISCVDWSAAATPTTGKDSIWVATVDETGSAEPLNLPTRSAWERWFRDLVERPADRPSSPPRLVGIDASFAAPAGLAAALGRKNEDPDPPWRFVWRTIAGLVDDGDDNANNRFEAGAELNAMIGGSPGPFWGRPPSHTYEHLLATRGDFPHLAASGTALTEYRIDEAWTRNAGRQPQSTWKLAYQASVGGQFLTCVARLHRLAVAHANLRFWPLETGFDAEPSPGEVWVSEVWPGAWPIDGTHEIRDANQVTTAANALWHAQTSGELADWLRGDSRLSADERAIVQNEEGWMLGPEHIRTPT